MNRSGPFSPSSAEVESAIFDLQRRFPDWVAVSNAGNSSQGRPVYRVDVSDPGTNPCDKQHLLVLAGQHGEEEGGRMIALALLQWLTGDNARAVRQNQKIVVMPNINPDGTEADTSKTSTGVNLNKDHAPAGPESPEGRIVEEVARELEPDAVVDLHCRGFAGFSHDMVMWPWTRPYTDDARCAAALAEEMAAAGEAAGIPHLVHPLTWPGWWENIAAREESHTLSYMYREFKSFCMLTETAESNEISRPAAMRVNAGLARLRAMLAWGQQRRQGAYYPGYPGELITVGGLAAVGATAESRRRSRVDIWRNLDQFSSFRGDVPEYPDRKALRGSYRGPELPHGTAFQLRCGGHWGVAEARLNGRELEPSPLNGYLTWQDVCSTCVRLNVPQLVPGNYELAVRLRP